MSMMMVMMMIMAALVKSLTVFVGVDWVLYCIVCLVGWARHLQTALCNWVCEWRRRRHTSWSRSICLC